MTNIQDQPETLILKPSKFKWIVLLLVLGGFTVAFVAVPDIRTDMHPILFYACVALFGSATAGAAAVLTLGINALQLDCDGFGFRSIWGLKQYAWRNVSSFRTISVPRVGSAVGFSINKSDGQNIATEFLAEANSSLDLPEILLPDTYGMDATDLQELMNVWRERSTSLPADQSGVATSDA